MSWRPGPTPWRSRNTSSVTVPANASTKNSGFAGERIVHGLAEALEALKRGHVQKLIVCADQAPIPGWQCRNCRALHVRGEGEMKACPSCGSMFLDAIDVRTEILRRAYRLGCAIEVRSRCSELEFAQGIAAVVTGEKK